ncbi:d-amino-acid oxidase [Fusarium coicis]|nr:d-amino-acid oxidase [Fusarium coicis]
MSYTTTAIEEATASFPSLNRLEIGPDEYAGLDPEWRKLWNTHGSSMVRADEVSIEDYRLNPAKYSFTYPTYQGPEVFHVEDRQIPVTKPEGLIKVRIYTPEGPGPFPVHLNFHGGGWVLGGLQSEAAWCRHMCNKASVKVIDVDYRMGPEYQYPTAIYDCWDAVKWTINNATELNINPQSVSFGGLSAGGHMTAVLGHFARDEGIDIKLQLMIVPATDMRYCSSKFKQLTAENCPYESVLRLKDVPWGPLGREKWFLKYFVGEDADELDEKLNNQWILTPVIAPNFGNLPRAHIVTAEFDLERDEGDIVIVGAGIIGLDVALVLSQQGYGKNIKVVAEYLPGDTSPSYTSPWAGCNFSAISGTDANAIKWDRHGYAHLKKLAAEDSDKSFVKRTPSIEFWDDNVPHDKIKAMADYLDDFRALSAQELPDGVKFGCAFTTLTVNAPAHCLYLYKKLREEYGVRFIRRKLGSIHEAYENPATKVVFNCTGNAAKTLAGVQDEKCYPTRGQVLLVRASHVSTNVMRHGKDYETYVIPRPGSNGNVILGGYMQKGNDDSATYSSESESILQRTTELSKELQQKEPEVLAAFAGMRPSREGGARIERDEIPVNGERRVIVHNYGAGGTGFQAGYGMALDAVRSIEDILSTLPTRSLL